MKTQGNCSDFLSCSHLKSEHITSADTLIGREQEQNELYEALNRTLCNGLGILIFCGETGIGKTSLVLEFLKTQNTTKSYFAFGKFEKNKQGLACSVLIHAFREFLKQILMESDKEIQNWKDELLATLGPNINTMIKVIPEIEFIIGENNEAPDLDSDAVLKRFRNLFPKLLSVFSHKERPFVLFLDDLQWIDLPSLSLIKIISANLSEKPLLIVGTYRTEDVEADHPLMAALEEIRCRNIDVKTIPLEELKVPDVIDLLATSLNCGKEGLETLSKLIWDKTNGNPFFAKSLITSLVNENHVAFDPGHGWKWDLESIKQLPITENVADLMIQRIHQLSSHPLETLNLAACIGSPFDSPTLASMNGHSEKRIRMDLLPFLESEILIFANGSYRFCHEKVQNFLYQNFDERTRKETHLQISRYFLDRLSVSEQESKIFDIVMHLNAGEDLVSLEEHREEFAQFNLRAALKAKSMCDYELALSLFKAGLRFLSPAKIDTDSNDEIASLTPNDSNNSSIPSIPSWISSYDLTLYLYVGATETAYLTGNFEEMFRHADAVFCNAHDLLDKIPAYEVTLHTYFAKEQFLECRQISENILKELGITTPKEISDDDLIAALTHTQSLLNKRSMNELEGLPEMTNSKSLAALRILSCLLDVARISKPALFPYVVLKMVEMTLEEGQAPESSYSFALFGQLLGSMGNPNSSVQFGHLGMKLQRQHANQPCQAKTPFGSIGFTYFRKQAIDSYLPLLLQANQTGMEIGDIQWSLMCANYYCYHSYLAGKELIPLSKKMESFRCAARHAGQDIVANQISIWQQAVLNLKGNQHRLISRENIKTSSAFGELAGDVFHESQMLPHFLKSENYTSTYFVYFNKMVLSYLFDETEAITYASQAEKYINAVQGELSREIFYFYDALICLTVIPEKEPTEQELLHEKVQVNLEKLKTLADQSPTNFYHKYCLVKAEYDRVLGNEGEARVNFDRAIEAARESRFIQEEALANELAARYYKNLKNHTLNQLYALNARSCYAQWGSNVKVQQLQRDYFRERTQINDGTSANFLGFQDSEPMLSQYSDPVNAEIAIQTSHLVSEERNPEDLLKKLLEIVMKYTGAKKVSLVLLVDGIWTVKAEAVNLDGNSAIKSSLSTTLDKTTNLPLSIINYVIRTKQTVTIPGIDLQDQFKKDPYLVQNRSLSLRSLPLMVQANLLGVLYLESDNSISSFTNVSPALITNVVSQVAIVFENSSLDVRVKKSEDNYRVLFQESKDALFMWTPGGQVFDINAAGLKLLGYSDKEISAEKILDQCVRKRDQLRFRKKIDQMGEVHDLELTIKRMDGTIRFGKVSATLIRSEDPSVPIYQGVVRDITESILSERKLRKLIESAPDAFVITEEEGKILIVNGEAERLFCYTRSELLTMTMSALIPHRFREKYDEDKESCIQKFEDNVQCNQLELSGLKKDGTEFPIEIRLSPLETEDGILTTAVIRDITNRKSAEKELQKSYSEIKALKERLEAEAEYLQEEIKVTHRFGEVVGQSLSIKKVLSQVEQVAGADTSVLITGETGTGKELVARAIHNLSSRKKRIMIKVNCAALPATLVESELFGREKGAFTGAIAKQLGRFEVADGSTIFLDEIGELSLEIQTKLLRVLQERQFERIGGLDTISVNVRVIAATNRNLAEEVRKGNFREDLYYRLRVFPIEVPLLKERKEDIPLLVWAFIKEFGEKMGKRIENVPRKTMDSLTNYPWPGNVRELRNVIEQAMLISKKKTLLVQLPKNTVSTNSTISTLKEMEYNHILDVMERTRWKIKGDHGAAKALGLNPSTLYFKMEKLGIPTQREKNEFNPRFQVKLN